MRVVEIKPAGKADVFNMEVEGTHSFIANGVVVHNCYDSARYFCMENPIPLRSVEAKKLSYDPFRQHRKE